LKSTYKYLFTILQNREILMFKKPGSKKFLYHDLSIHMFHNFSGIVSLCNNRFLDDEKLKAEVASKILSAK